MEKNLDTGFQNGSQDHRLGSRAVQVRISLGGSQDGKSLGVNTGFGRW